ncbi:phage tail protein [Gilliamella sp. B2969]|uniref:phage tail protein n=1 Tax=Gilliamella sp. B2969 TaxID=2818021 RepID=UPI002269C243|nr:phage tail protein [Gilliamella sp. B2969]MCX8731165.1 phage tail protein [Gilliamella sp. B2969]
MSSISLNEMQFNDMLPHSINHDETIQNISKSIDVTIKQTENDFLNVDIYSQIDIAEEPLLSTLAWHFSLTHEYLWKLAESLTAKRELLKISTKLHQKKGTPWAIRNIIRALGYGDIDIVEGLGIRYRNGQFCRNGIKKHSLSENWACYRIIFHQPITNDIAELLRRAIPEYAPARCKLVSLDYRAAAARHNGMIKNRNGQYNRGIIKNG